MRAPIMNPDCSAASVPWMRCTLSGNWDEVAALDAPRTATIDEALGNLPHFQPARAGRGRNGHRVSFLAESGDCMGLASSTPDITRLLEGLTSGRPKSPVRGVHPGARARVLHSVAGSPPGGLPEEIRMPAGRSRRSRGPTGEGKTC